ncbi:MAG TPA: ABC transporter ATP-binding protein [Acholeplasmataceae bacterium]|nr:ABC transporter ATP-binding protein [Acholeplasmataceae bacterium]
MKIINLINLSKSYRNPVINNISYSFIKGKTYLLVGENGSGKTTLIKLIMGFISPTSGKIEKLTKSISYVPDNLSFPDFLNVNEFLINLGNIYGLNNISDEITDLANDWELDCSLKLSELSKGMRQKVLIIQAFLKAGDVYIFDEPLNGLDKKMQELLSKKIKVLKNEGKTIIIISHQINIFSSLIDVILEIKDGKLYERVN